MKKLTSLAAYALALGSALPIFAGTALTNLVPDSTALYYSVENIPAVRNKWEKSPFARTWADEQVQRFFAPLITKLDVASWEEKVKAETGHGLQEMLNWISGDALIAITSFDFASTGEANMAGKVPLLMALELGSHAKDMEKLVLSAQAKTKDSAENNTRHSFSEETFNGAVVHTIEEYKNDALKEAFYWSVTDGVFLFAGSKATLLSAIDSLRSGGASNSLGKSAGYLNLKQRTGNAPLLAAINIRSIYPVLQEAIAKKAAQDPKPNPMLDTSKILPALGLDAVGDIYVGCNISDSSTVISGALTYSEQRGLMKALAYRSGPPSYPSWVPAKAIAINTAKFEVGALYGALEDMLNTMNPMLLGMAQMQLKNLETQFGIDVKRDFFGSFGDSVISGNLPQPGSSGGNAGMDQLDAFMAISLNNPEALSGLLAKLRLLAGPQADAIAPQREYLGQTITTLALPQPNPSTGAQQSISFAVAKGHFLLGMGSPTALDAVIQSFDGSQSPLWERPEIRRAIAETPAAAASFSYQDSRAMIGIIFETLARLPVGNEQQIVDPAAKPSAEVIGQYWKDAYGHLEVDAQGLYFKSTLNH